MTPEGRVKKEIKAYLTKIGAYFFMPVQGGFGARSLDFLCCVNGRFVAIEAKREGCEASKFQEITIAAMGKAGAIVFVAHSGAEVKEQFKLNGLV